MKQLLILSLTICLITACKKDTSNQSSGAPSPDISGNTHPFIKCSLDGYNFDYTLNGTTNPFIHEEGWDEEHTVTKVNYAGAVGRFQTAESATSELVIIGVYGLTYNFGQYSDNAFQNALSNFPQNFYNAGLQNVGLDVRYQDSLGNEWFSRFTDQTDSQITISENVEASPHVGYARRRLKGSVSCKL